jgi:ribonuclease T1
VTGWQTCGKTEQENVAFNRAGVMNPESLVVRSGRHGMWHRLWQASQVGVACLLAATAAMAFQPGASDIETIRQSDLPAQGQTVLRLIEAGGPFPHDKDGTVFGNRERQLPKHKRGYYREYTVATPGLNHRGARRIVCGGENTRAPDACYYTKDHYASFKLIVSGL